MQIVIAWLEASQEIARVGRVDLGEAHRFRDVMLPKSCIWLNNGTAGDLAKARAYAAKEGRQVFTYEGERDPLGRGRQDVAR